MFLWKQRRLFEYTNKGLVTHALIIVLAQSTKRDRNRIDPFPIPKCGRMGSPALMGLSFVQNDRFMALRYHIIKEAGRPQQFYHCCEEAHSWYKWVWHKDHALSLVGAGDRGNFDVLRCARCLQSGDKTETTQMHQSNSGSTATHTCLSEPVFGKWSQRGTK